MWLQVLVGLLYHDWEDIHIIYLQSLGVNNTGHIWVSSLIKTLWDTVWYIWNYKTHTIRSTDGTTKTDILACIETIINYHLLRFTTRLPQRLHFFFKTNAHNLLSRLFLQHLSWLASIYSARRCAQRKPRKGRTSFI